MDLLITCLLFALGIALVVRGGDIFVGAASGIAKALNIPSFIIGATIVSLATTMPEMLVSAIAAAEGKTDMAIGNAVGSVTANTALIMATAMLAMHIVCSRKQYMRQILLLMAAAGVLVAACAGGRLQLWGSIVLAVIFVLFMVQNALSARKEMAVSRTEGEAGNRKRLRRNVVLFVIGAAAVVIGSRLMVDHGSDLAVRLGVPERVIAVTLIAIGTSLPELVTTVTAIVKRESALSIGNIIGANIIDLSLILPVCSLVSGEALPVSAQSAMIDLPVCLGVTLLAMVPLLIREKASRVQGIVLVAVYAGYLILTLM